MLPREELTCQLSRMSFNWERLRLQRQLVLFHPEQNVFQTSLGGQNMQPLFPTGAWSWTLSSETVFTACEEWSQQQLVRHAEKRIFCE